MRAGRDRRRRYGPRFLIYPLTALGLAAIGLFLTRYPEPVLLGCGILVVLATLSGWTWYEVDARGVVRRTPLGTRRWAWAEIGGIQGHRIRQARHPTIHTLVQRAVDSRGRELFRLNPWLARRRELVSALLEGSRGRDRGGGRPDAVT